MLESLLTVAGQVVTLFLMMAIGFALVQFGLLNNDGLSQMASLLLYVVAPCIIVDSVQRDDLPGLALLGVAALALGSYYLLMPLSGLLYRGERLDKAVVLRVGTVYGNTGFMGIPLLTVLLGPQALIYGAVSVVLFNTSQWLHAAVVMGGSFSVKKAFLNPGVIGLLLGLPFVLFPVRLPEMVGSAVHFMAGLNTPLAMVVIGGQMAGANLVATFTQPKLYLVAALKLLVIPAVVAVALQPFRLDGLLYCTCVILAATPTAGITGIFAQKFGRDTSTAAQLITLTTLLSVLTLPIFAVLSQTLVG